MLQTKGNLSHSKILLQAGANRPKTGLITCCYGGEAGSFVYIVSSRIVKPTIIGQQILHACHSSSHVYLVIPGTGGLGYLLVSSTAVGTNFGLTCSFGLLSPASNSNAVPSVEYNVGDTTGFR